MRVGCVCRGPSLRSRVRAGSPKSRAGSRTVIVPQAVRADIVAHMAEFVKPGDDALLFTGEQGRAIRRGTFNPRVKWTTVVADLGAGRRALPRPSARGNIWASKAGMSTKDLMARMGHDDMRAALIYQRATSDADRLIAERLSSLVDEHRRKGKKAAKKIKKKRRKGGDDGPDEVAAPVA